MIIELLVTAAALSSGEDTYYSVDHLALPEGEVVEVGGLAFLPDGSLLASTRRGRIWKIDNPLVEDPREARFHL